MILRKPFNQQWHDDADEKGREYAKAMFLKIYKLYAIDNIGKYKIDLVVYNGYGKIVCYADAEIKKYLDDFRFDTLHILERKSKYFADINGKPTLFCLFSPDGKICAMTRGSYLLNMKSVEVKNKAMAYGEHFYKVPMNMVRMINLGVSS